MKDEIVSYTLDTKNFSPAILVVEEHAHYMNMCTIEIFTLMSVGRTQIISVCVKMNVNVSISLRKYKYENELLLAHSVCV